MNCFSPVTGWRAAGGQLTLNRRKMVSPVPLTVRCRQCAGCRLEGALDWSIRIMHEARVPGGRNTRRLTSFLTLTYDDEHLPRTPMYGLPTLRPEDFTNFMKKLRRAEDRRAAGCDEQPNTFRYYHVGEYGESTYRPHYHAAFFGDDFREGSTPWQRSSYGHGTWTNPRLDAAWGNGRVVVGTLTAESAQYVARYIMKKRTGYGAKRHYYTRTPEYVTMSRRPGIGAAWFDKYKSDVYPLDEVAVGKHTRTPPKFYDDLLERERPELLKKLKLQRQEKAKPFVQTTEQLQRREEAVEYRLARNIRELTPN